MSVHRRALVQTGARFAVCLLAAPNAHSQQAGASHPIALQISNYPLPFIPIGIDGVSVLALVDTGSSASLRLSARLAARLNLGLAPRPNAFVQGLDGRRIAVQQGRARRLSAGPFSMDAPEFEVAGERIEGIAAQVGTPFDAVLGWGFLAQMRFVLDFPARQLLLARSPDAPVAPARASVPVATIQGLPILHGHIDDKPVQLLLDTGAPMCNLDPDMASAVIGSVLTRTLTIGALSLAMQWRVKDLSAQRRAVATVGTLGNNFLMRYTIAFDPASGFARFY